MARLKNFIIIFIMIGIIRVGLSYYQKNEIEADKTFKAETTQEEDYIQSEEFKLKQKEYSEKRREGLNNLQKQLNRPRPNLTTPNR